MTEVAFSANELEVGLTEEGEAKIDRLWGPASPITLVDVTEVTAREGRALLRAAKEQGIGGLRSADATHLATARLRRCDEVFTYEVAPTRAKWQRLVERPVKEPYLEQPPMFPDP